jgi:hypothetical protein
LLNVCCNIDICYRRYNVLLAGFVVHTGVHMMVQCIQCLPLFQAYWCCDEVSTICSQSCWALFVPNWCGRRLSLQHCA